MRVRALSDNAGGFVWSMGSVAAPYIGAGRFVLLVHPHQPHCDEQAVLHERYRAAV